MILGRSELLSPADSRWPEMLARVRHDIYHSAGYHRSPQLGRDGDPYLFAYQEGDLAFLWPYLLAPVDPSGVSSPASLYDVTSVYGYAGPVASSNVEFIQRGWHALLDHWRMQGAVSAFTRFHPLLGNQALSEHFQDVSIGPAENQSRHCGATISIDLTLDSPEQVRRYQKVLRQEIRKSRELGFTTCLDEEWRHQDDFLRLYRSTMMRREGKSEYLIDANWLTRFRESVGCGARLFVTKYDGVVAAALLAMEYGPFLHAHLTGINADLVAYSPLKVLLDDVRQWGTERSLQSFHLGGGLGGQQDSLFQFKRRFSPLVHEFSIGAWILKPLEYRELSLARQQGLREQGIDVSDAGFFPAYRYQAELPLAASTP
ncbi:MAG: GNAT family N-acetyltransferase [Acidobacteriota bacterium]